jgi:hypothetical protein
MMEGIKGIKCDNCDYADMEVPFSDYTNWINKPCPKCGENLLTQQDYDLCKSMEGFVDDMRKIPGFKNLEEQMLNMMGPEANGDVSFDVMKDIFGSMFGAQPEKEEISQKEEILEKEEEEKEKIEHKHKRTRRGRKK